MLKEQNIEQQILKMLQKHDLRKTACRLSMLKIFIQTPYALSSNGLEEKLNNLFDRVTIYRTLTTFEDCGILHKVPSDSGVSFYAICKNGCTHTKHEDKHIHFQCNVCQKTFCLDEVKDFNFNLPKGYIIQQWKFLFSGICATCNI